MATTSPPVALVPGVSTQIPQPGGGQFGYVVLSNLSSYMLTVQVGADTFLLAPFTEQLYELKLSTTSPLGLTPTLLMGQAVVAGASAQANVTWFTFGEGVPKGNWPISLPAQALASISGVLAIQQQFNSTQIFDQVIPAGLTNSVAINGYASLLMFEFASPSGTAGSVITEHIQAFLPGTLFALDDFWATSELTNTNGFLAIACPVLGNFLTLKNWHPTQASQIAVYGTNVQLSAIRRWLGYGQLPRRINSNNPVVNGGQIASMPIVDLPAGALIPNQMSFNGLFTVSGQTNVAGTIYLYYLDPSNALIGLPLQVLTAGQSFDIVNYFEGYARIVFVPAANTTTLNIGAIVTSGAASQ